MESGAAAVVFYGAHRVTVGPTLSRIRPVQWLTGGGFGVVALDVVGEFVAHRSVDGRLRRFNSQAAAYRSALGSVCPFGWSRDLVAFRPLAGGGLGGLSGSGLEDSASNTVRFVPLWEFRQPVRRVGRPA